ncbi:MAG: TerB family tellurite resistance protein [Lysobacterales bacterium]
MHIIIGLLGSLISLAWVLYRLAEMGVDLGGLNPWLWRRRRNWQKRYEANPVYAVEKPMDATALVMAAVAKADGDMSAEEKRSILDMFQSEFHQSEKDAAALLRSSTFLLGNSDTVLENLEKVLEPSQPNFSQEQAQSAVAMIDKVYQLAPAAGSDRETLARKARAILLAQAEPPGKWD